VIITFYSYKGGVGRSMALANIAELLYQRGLDVLIVDWDLEAPGLERFFAHVPIERMLQQPGVIDMLEDYKAVMTEDLQLWPISDRVPVFPFVTPAELAIDISPQPDRAGRLRLLTAGRRSSASFARYTETVLQFDWADFYRSWHGELYFEWLREQFMQFDVVLIDSRTGLTEMSGICTYQLADVVVLLCAPNQQSIAGTRAMAQSLQRAEVATARQGRPLDLIVVPARVDDRNELTLLTAFRAQFVETFDGFMPESLRPDLDSFWRYKIPYVSFFAFNEVVAVREEDAAAAEPLLEAFAWLVRALAKLAPVDSALAQLVGLVVELPVRSQGEQTLGYGIQGVFHGPVTIITGSPSALIDPEAAQARLAALPIDEVPDVAALSASSHMPLSRNPLFVGRTDALVQLAAALRGDAAEIGRIAAITGMGGIGKTQLAVEFVHRYGQFFAGGCHWCSFDDRDGVPAQIAACGGVGALNVPGFDDLRLDDQVQLVEQAWRQPLPRLLVFDNCEDETLLQRWLPTTGGSRVLVTSRRAAWDAALGVRVLALDALPRVESIALLGQFRPDLAADDPDLAQIAAELGDLPLALYLAGRYLGMYRDDLAPAAYLAEVQAALLEHPSLIGEDQAITPTKHSVHVRRTISLSYDRLDAVEPVDALARALLARAACFAPDVPIPRALLEATVEAVDARQVRRALRRLSNLGLLEREGVTALRLHRLVAAFVRRDADDDTAQLMAEQALLDMAEALDQDGLRAQLLELQPHLHQMIAHALVLDDEPAATRCTRLAYRLNRIGDYASARALYKRALAIREQVLGPEHPDTVTTMNNLAGLLQSQGDYAAARVLYVRALAIREVALGPRHATTATSLNNLAELLRSQGDYAAARPLLERALVIRERALGPQHPDTAQSLNNLAALLKDQGDYAAARPLYARALAIREAALGPQHPDTAQSLNNLAGLLQVLGEYAAARQLLERALAVREAALGPQHPDTAASLNNLAALLQTQREYAGARPLYERALTIWERAVGPEHPEMARTLNNLAALLAAEREYAQAQLLCERALDICERRLGRGHPDTARSISNLGSLLHLQGKYAVARSYLEESLAIREQALGAEHPDTAGALANLAHSARDTGNRHEARVLYARALGISERALGAEHAETINRRDALSSVAGEE
jgi:tetratricopeptide (TPR) repeat protein/MinD-like ATPase involved in chromosome partitioning or flagellar assembly